MTVVLKYPHEAGDGRVQKPEKRDERILSELQFLRLYLPCKGSASAAARFLRYQVNSPAAVNWSSRGGELR